MFRPPPLPPRTARSDAAQPSAVRGLALRLAAAGIIVALCGSCRSGARLADTGRPSRETAVTELTRPVADASLSRRTADITSSNPAQSLAAVDERPAEKPRRRLPSWFPGGEQPSVPLPTTPVADETAAEAPTGPVEQFQ